MRVPVCNILKRMVTVPLRNFFLRIDAHVEVVVEQIVVGAIRSVNPPPQDVGPAGADTTGGAG